MAEKDLKTKRSTEKDLGTLIMGKTTRPEPPDREFQILPNASALLLVIRLQAMHVRGDRGNTGMLGLN